MAEEIGLVIFNSDMIVLHSPAALFVQTKQVFIVILKA